MLSITVELLHGVYRADPDGTVHTGHLERGEWPPTPGRLFSALVAADGTGARLRVTSGVELLFLEHLPPPIIVADADYDVVHTPLLARFVVEAGTHVAAGGAAQEYVVRKSTELRPGVRVAPRHPRVSFVWPDCQPTVELERGLRLRAARVGYLGCADSPVAVTVDTDDHEIGEPTYRPHSDGGLALGVPAPGLLAALDAHFERWSIDGPSVRRSQSPGLRRLARYQGPAHETTAAAPSTEAIWLMFDRRVSGRRLVAVTDTLRKATLDLYARHIGEAPPVLHGHMTDSSGYDTARYVALPDVGHPNAKGLLHGAAIVFPVGTPKAIADTCRDAMRHLRDLVGPGFETTVRLWAGESTPRAATPQRWVGPSTRWVSVAPALHERRKKALSLDDLALWCDHAGLPRPIAFRESRSSFIAGGLALSAPETRRPDRPGRTYSHFELIFESPVTGPVVFGAGRQYGLGLCAPFT